MEIYFISIFDRLYRVFQFPISKRCAQLKSISNSFNSGIRSKIAAIEKSIDFYIQKVRMDFPGKLK